MECILSLIKWINWEAFGAIGTVGSLWMLVWPKIEARRNIQSKVKRMNKFFHDLQDNGWPEYYGGGAKGLERLYIINYKNNGDSNSGTGVLFFYYQNVFFNSKPDLYVNNIKIPEGYNFFKVINEKVLSLTIIDDSTGNKVCAYIYKSNNIAENNENIFEKIVRW